MRNEQIERLNRKIEAMLSKVVKEGQQDWDRHLQKHFWHAGRPSMNPQVSLHIT